MEKDLKSHTVSTFRRMKVLRDGTIIKAWPTKVIFNLSPHTESTYDNNFKTEQNW